MEFQADLVSVSVTGSDALVNALHRLGAADGAWSIALSVLAREAGRGKAVPDLFTIQTRVIEHMARILNEPRSRRFAANTRRKSRAASRIRARIGRTSAHGSTHPPNQDRELNAKRVYVPATLDSRSAFCLFRNPKKLRKRVTAEILAEAKEKLVRISEEKALAAVDKRFDKPYLSERYRGVYLGRQIGLTKKTPGELYGGKVPEDQSSKRLAALYPEELASDIRDLRVRNDERSSLEALRDGFCMRRAASFVTVVASFHAARSLIAGRSHDRGGNDSRARRSARSGVSIGTSMRPQRRLGRAGGRI
ncbi:MAG: hypothetical protein IPM54_38430 [Polyangiaceae bacterium]|nr:hypothetical protein [Polyangiaceae bacterium]